MVSNEELVRLYKSTDSKKSKEILFKKILEKNINGIKKIVGFANNFNNRDFYEDLFQEACIHLIKCINKYNEESGVSFWTFARKALENKNCQAYKVLNNQVKRECSSERLSPNFVGYMDDEHLTYNLDKELKKKIIKKYVGKIFKKESNSKKFFLLKHGLADNQPMTYELISNICGVSRQGAQQACVRYERKLKKVIEQDLNNGLIMKDDLY